ncbi:DUF3426 domain-containing protein [Hydrogenophaga aromaticivorans]|uniref:DUF3426 domain-containing protein n=1 Tax=Hydrogenophaga aromaticivorans TaxID=2610898 RepID=UPI001B3749E6|nr:DUF3426 domain-containing protein [Hydrogenophaga aromaticivorans]MBQ0918197.1 DUF3426 domain-containing protein [Hydrogenophaga aromaticivorans]
MSFTTRCPACGTMFKVVPDQLKISDGWVRCGHCADVFDATLYLQTWEAPAPEPQPAPAAAPAAAPESPQPSGTAPASVPSETANDLPTQALLAPAIEEAIPQATGVWDPSAAVIEDANEPSGQTLQNGWLASSDIDDGDWLLAPPAEEWSPQQEAQDAADWQALQAPVAPPFESPFAPLEAVRALAESGPLDFEGQLELANQPESPAVASRDDGADFQAELKRFAAAAAGASRAVEAEVKTAPPPPAPVPPSAPAPVPQPERVSLEDDPAVQEVEPGFVLQARRQAFWRSPGMRAALLLLAVTLTALLAAQWAVQERDQLAARQPSLVPLLNLLCKPSGCVLQAPRNIEAVVIDSSTLVRRLGNFCSFDLVLKNSASTPVAMPALELSLTDTADAVITRRVFLAEELPGAPVVLPAQGTQAVSLRLSLAEGGASAMTGYRALVFYP